MALQNHRIYTNYQNFTAFYLDWTEESISNGISNYSSITWRVGIRASGGNPSWFSNSIKILSANLGGNGLTTGTWSNISLTSGQSYQLGNGSFNYGHNSNGTGSISGSIKGWLYANGDSTTASGSWNLTTIPRYATISSTSGNINDETDPVKINFSNPPGGAVTAYMYVRPGTSGGWTLVATRGSYSSGTNFSLTTGERNTARGALPNTNTGQVLYRITNSVGNTDSTSTFTIISANPTFSTYTYKDDNATMVALTGSDQVIVQNPGGLTNPTSDLLVTVSAANKALPLKEATMVDYLTTLGAFSSTEAYSSGSDVTEDIGPIAVAGAQTLQVRARDSRGNYTQVDTGITVLPYGMPIVNAHLSRSDNFNADVTLTFDLIQISSITVGGVDKNGVKSTATGTANRIEYRYLTNSGAYGSWVDRTASVGAGSGGVATVTVASLILVSSPTANNTYTAQVRVTDKLGNATTLTIYLGSGQPVFRIGTDDLTYNNEQPLMPSHVGLVIMSVSLVTAGDVADIYGGTWTAWAVGRVPVGVDTGQSEFNTVEQTGGHKLTQAHVHSVDPPSTTTSSDSHTHSISNNYVRTSASGSNRVITSGSGQQLRWDSAAPNATGSDSHTHTVNIAAFDSASYGGGDSENLQPYVTCYFWKRTV